MKKHTYQAVSVEEVRVGELLARVVSGCVVALDVAKTKWLVAVATLAGEVVKLFRFEHPKATARFLEVVRALQKSVQDGRVEVVMEPTGTYGDAIRHQLVGAGLRIFMVSPKRTHDSKELFDGVPSLHDAKSAVLIVRLHAMKLSKEWQAPSSTVVRLRALVDLRRREGRREEDCHGSLEASLSRHWPELGQSVSFREHKSVLQLLSKYPSPSSAAAASEDVKRLLHSASRGRLTDATIDAVLAGARSTLGVPMVAEEERCVQLWATQALDANEHRESLRDEMKRVGASDAVYERLLPWMGPFTAAVLVTMCHPMKYASARQLEKAAGLNLREKSSGEHTGRRSITKRGPSLVRQVVYLFALRTIRASDVVRAWYERRRGYTEGSKSRAIVAVMRKLVRAAFYVARGSAFDVSKLFDVRRLERATTKAEATSSATAVAVVTPSVASGTTPSMSGARALAATPTTSPAPERSASTTTPGASEVAHVERHEVRSRTEDARCPPAPALAPLALSDIVLAAKAAVDACGETSRTKRPPQRGTTPERRPARRTARAST